MPQRMSWNQASGIVGAFAVNAIMCGEKIIIAVGKLKNQREQPSYQKSYNRPQYRIPELKFSAPDHQKHVYAKHNHK